MSMQHSLTLEPGGSPVAQRPAPGRCFGHGAVFLVTGGPMSEACAKLLDRAMTDAGLAGHEPFELARASASLPAPRLRRHGQARLVVAFGSEAASAFLRRPVSLNLERGRVRPLPEGDRVLITEHPRAILAQADPVARGREYRRLVNDLLLAVPHRRLAS